MTDIVSSDPVRHQYEAYPYPLRDPNYELIRLIVREVENLGQINHFVFGGRQSFGPGTRILVAGGGTGDEVVYFGEQLKTRGGSVTYLDQSLASMAVARTRVEKRGLTNVEFQQGRIEDVSVEALGTFDYIHSIGVLHHIADPALGLQRLAALLRPGGGMGLMVYGLYGRQGNYQLQALAKKLFMPEQPLPSQVDEMVTVINSLPPDHPFFRGGGKPSTVEWIKQDPNELVDAVLHARDRPFTVGDVYDWLASASLGLIEFVPFLVNKPGATFFTLFYDPCSYITDPGLVARLRAMPARARHEIAELINGRIDLHCFYASKTADVEAVLTAPDMVPYLMCQRRCFSFTDDKMTVTTYADLSFTLPSTPVAKMLFELMDGERTVAEIIQEGYLILDRAGHEMINLHVAFQELFNTLRAFNWGLLRHRSVPAFENLDHLYYEGAGWSPPA